MKLYKFFLNSIFIFLLLLCSCKQHNNQSATVSFSIRNITYNNSNFFDSMRICNQADNPFLVLNTINKDGSVVGSVFKSDTGNNKNCIPYPMLFNNNLLSASVNNNSMLVKSATQIGNNPKSVMIAGITNDNNKILYMPFGSLQPGVSIDKAGYDSVISSPLGDFIAGVSTSITNNPKDILLYNVSQSIKPINVQIKGSNFIGSLFNMGTDDTQSNAPLLITGYQYADSMYNAVLCSLNLNDPVANCEVVIPKYISVDSVANTMPINMFIAPDASVVYAVTNNGKSNIVVSIDPMRKQNNPVEISALNIYNIKSIDYISVGSRNDQGKLIQGGVISVFTSADEGNPQYMMIFNQFGKYQVVPLALLLYNLGIKNPNNYQFVNADSNFQHLLLKNTASFSSPGPNSILYTVINFNENSSKFINNKFADSDINTQISLIESVLNEKE